MVIPVRPGDHNPSLVLTLRSIAENFPHRKVWLAGYCPRWVDTNVVGYLPVEQLMSHWSNVLHIMDEVVRDPEISEKFVFFNDDFYVLSPVKAAPIIYEGTLEERAQRLKGLSLGDYSRGALRTLEVLREAGYEAPRNFDLHIPIPMDKESVQKALSLLSVPYNFWPHFRSMVGTIAGYEGVSGKDNKLSGVAQRIPPGSEYLSTSVRSLGAGYAGRELRRKFPHVSRFEKAYAK